MRVRPWSTATVLLVFVLVSLGAATREGVTYRRWHDISGDSVEEIYADPDYQVDNPDYEEVLADLCETPTNICDSCASELWGWFKAPLTGPHTFYIAADDGAVLHFGPTEAEAPIIANVPGWTPSRLWNRYPSQASSPQHLEAGKFYYMRGIANELWGGDNLAIGVTLPDGTDLKPLPVAGYVFVEPILFAWVGVDVVGLGAVSDGVTDSSAAFLNASAQTLFGGEIIVPIGRYRTSAFNLSSNTRLVIYGDIQGIPSRIPRDYSSSAWQPQRSDQALIGWAPDAQNISIVGNGSISNRGSGWTTNRVGFVCPHFAVHNLPPSNNAAGLEEPPQYDAAIECGPSDTQRAALFAPLDFEAPPLTAPQWRRSRGEQRNAAATFPEPQP